LVAILLVPGTAVAVTLTHSVITDTNTGQAAAVSSHALHVSGPVTSTDLLPTANFHRYVRLPGSGDLDPVTHEWQFIEPVTSLYNGQGLALGTLDVPNLDQVPGNRFIYLVTVSGATKAFKCELTTLDNPSVVPQFVAGLTAHETAEYNFPVPLVMTSQAGMKTCVYVVIYGDTTWIDVGVPAFPELDIVGYLGVHV